MERNYNQKFSPAIIGIVAVGIAIAIILAVIFAYISSQNPYYGYDGYNGGMMGGSGNYGGVWMIFFVLIGLVILAILGWAIWRGVNWGGGCCGGHSGHDYSPSSGAETAMETLRRRYANGEITREQFEQMKRDIS